MSKIVFLNIIYSEYALIIRVQVETAWLGAEKIRPKNLKNALNIGIKSVVSDVRTDN